VNNRCEVNYIGKFSNSYILGSIMNYKSATGFKVSGKCNKIWSIAEIRKTSRYNSSWL